MGRLREIGQAQEVELHSRVLIGRSLHAGLRIPDPRVSSEHAVLWWEDQHWHLRDLASRNGTFVNGEKLAPGQTAVLVSGTELRFGEHAGWHVTDISPPVARAEAADGTIVRAVDGLLALPSEDDPQVVLYQNAQGLWVEDREGMVQPVLPGVPLQLDQLWDVFLPVVEQATIERRTEAPGEIALRFEVSSDEEHVQVAVDLGDGWKRIAPRAHHYTLLTLARLRLAADNPSDPEAGWVHVEDLAKMVGARRGLVNMHVLRIRRELEALGAVDGAALIQRRPLSCTLQLATPAVEVGGTGAFAD